MQNNLKICYGENNVTLNYGDDHIILTNKEAVALLQSLLLNLE